MKNTHRSGFSLIELLMVISIIALLASLLSVSLVSAKARSRQAACINNLRQIGLGFTGFSLDHDGKYPMDVPERLGGSAEYNQSNLVENTRFSRDFHHFIVMSNDAPNINIMTCPADKNRKAGRNFASFNNANLSYWVNITALPQATLSTLAGDWNIQNPGASSTSSEQVSFGREVHRRKGSVLFADGRVEITRSIHVEISRPQIVEATPDPSTTPPHHTAGLANGNPQPATASLGPAAAGPSKIPEPITGKGSTLHAQQETNDANGRSVAINTYTKATGGFRRVGRPAEVREDSSVRPVVNQSQNTVSGSASLDSADEPWNTAGFRLFKALAFVSYLISLLWALIALLLLYLKSRLSQRRRQEEASINTN